MGAFGKQLFILVIVYICDSSCVTRATYEAGKGLWRLHLVIDNMTSHMENVNGANKLLENARQNEDIKDATNHIYNQLNRMEKSMNSKIIRGSLKLSPSEMLLYRCMDQLDIYVQSIDEQYRRFNKSMENLDNYADDSWKNSPGIVIDIESTIAVIRNIMYDGNPYLADRKSLPSAITDRAIRLSTQSCDDAQIVSSLLVKIFTIAMIAEIKAGVMLTFANVNLYATNRGWIMMNILVRKKFEEQFKQYVNIFETNVASTDSLYLRACDPKEGTWKRNESFYEIEKTFQTTIFRYRWAYCKYSRCQSIWFDKSHACEADIYDKRSSCSATVDDCFPLKSVEACVLKRGPHKFQYVISTELGSLGRNFTCPKQDDGYIIEDGSGLSYNFGTCACNCYEDHNRISFLLMQSDVKFNRVITGLRFYRGGSTLWIQPRTGKLHAHGYVDRRTETWMRIPNTVMKSQTHPINKETRVFFLDDLRLPLNYALTGVKFNKVTRENVTGFAIQIFGLLFHSESGELYSQDDHRISRRASNKTSRKGLSFQPVSSIYTTLVHTVNPREMKYVSLHQSTLESDFGQSTLPLFDAVPIQLDSPSALGGIGIYHKGVEGYAGFISLRVYGIKYAGHFRNFKFLHMQRGENLFGQ